MISPVDCMLVRARLYEVPPRYSPDEVLWDIGCSSEVGIVWGIKWKVGGRAATLAVLVDHRADTPPCPSRKRWRARNIARIYLEEVDLIDRVAVSDAS